MEEKISRA
jgi:hypothetical protein